MDTHTDTGLYWGWIWSALWGLQVDAGQHLGRTPAVSSVWLTLCTTVNTLWPLPPTLFPSAVEPLMSLYQLIAHCLKVKTWMVDLSIRSSNSDILTYCLWNSMLVVIGSNFSSACCCLPPHSLFPLAKKLWSIKYSDFCLFCVFCLAFSSCAVVIL